jgi:hypothetical protein
MLPFTALQRDPLAVVSRRASRRRRLGSAIGPRRHQKHEHADAQKAARGGPKRHRLIMNTLKEKVNSRLIASLSGMAAGFASIGSGIAFTADCGL